MSHYPWFRAQTEIVFQSTGALDSFGKQVLQDFVWLFVCLFVCLFVYTHEKFHRKTGYIQFCKFEVFARGNFHAGGSSYPSERGIFNARSSSYPSDWGIFHAGGSSYPSERGNFHAGGSSYPSDGGIFHAEVCTRHTKRRSSTSEWGTCDSSDSSPSERGTCHTEHDILSAILPPPPPLVVHPPRTHGGITSTVQHIWDLLNRLPRGRFPHPMSSDTDISTA